MTSIRNAIVLAGLSACAMAHAVDCPAPPISTAASATCRAESYLAKGARVAWTLKYQAEELKEYWLVTYSPTDSNVRGGGGKLRIEKATGQATFVEGYR
jgi:hypothetical protein